MATSNHLEMRSPGEVVRGDPGEGVTSGLSHLCHPGLGSWAQSPLYCNESAPSQVSMVTMCKERVVVLLSAWNLIRLSRCTSQTHGCRYSHTISCVCTLALAAFYPAMPEFTGHYCNQPERLKSMQGQDGGYYLATFIVKDPFSTHYEGWAFCTDH